MNYPELAKMVQDHVLSLFRSQKDKSFVYHNSAHTEGVVRAATQIANHYQLNERDFFIDYCQLLLNDKKRENLERLKLKAAGKESRLVVEPVQLEKNKQPEKAKQGEKAKQPDKAKQPEKKDQVVPVIPMVDDSLNRAADNAQAKKKKEEKAKRPDRGIETMFRITSGNNQRLSDMADNKAHIMITVNSIILSAIISLLLRKLEEYDFLRWPTYLILIVCVLTIIFSIVATRPNLPPGRFTQTDIEEKKVNLLFFGNFYRMNLTDYTAGMLQVMNDRDFLYGTLIKDVYSQGVVLGRKFRLLRISYNIFMYGLIASVIAFVAATIISGK